MGHVKTLHIVGYKNSGKTTLVSRFIRVAKEAGLKVAVIKHHGHGARLAMPDGKKDSMQYLKNGADTSIVAGGGYVQHISQGEADFADLHRLALLEKPDVLLVEGYKQETAEKVVLVRGGSDWETLQELDHITLVVGLDASCHYPQISSRENRLELEDWFNELLNL